MVDSQGKHMYRVNIRRGKISEVEADMENDGMEGNVLSMEKRMTEKYKATSIANKDYNIGYSEGKCYTERKGR